MSGERAGFCVLWDCWEGAGLAAWGLPGWLSRALFWGQAGGVWKIIMGDAPHESSAKSPPKGSPPNTPPEVPPNISRHIPT